MREGGGSNTAIVCLFLVAVSCGGGGTDGNDVTTADTDSKETEIQKCGEATDCEQFQCKVAQCKSSECVYVDKADHTPCDDNDDCTVDESCQKGECSPEKNICGGECEKDEDCLAKDDGNLCNGVPWCVEKKCILKLESIVKCEKTSNTCAEIKCDPKDGKCNENKKEDNSPCSDGDECTAGDFCISGECEPGSNICECDSDDDCGKHESFCKGNYV
ncbi:MAG: hypothetical protein FJ088_08290, partial [Deltaproteobacteria bacterium]|nr:hypothetical protein [Deltaproteobacteria bacterium]